MQLKTLLTKIKNIYIFSNNKLALVASDKNLCVLIITRYSYNNKLETMLNDWIDKGIYAGTEDTTMEDLKKF